jgi:hypothetical protein
MNARHTFRVPFLAATAFLMIGTSAALADRHDQPKQLGPAPNHSSQVHAGQFHNGQVHATPSDHGGLTHSSVYHMRPGFQVHRTEATNCRPYPTYPAHRHPAAVVVGRPVIVYPPVVYDTTCIRIVNPAEVGVTVSYTLDGQQVFLQPGEIQMLHRRCVITFDRGNGYGFSQLVLTGGTYMFGWASDGGWSLFRN